MCTWGYLLAQGGAGTPRSRYTLVDNTNLGFIFGTLIRPSIKTLTSNIRRLVLLFGNFWVTFWGKTQKLWMFFWKNRLRRIEKGCLPPWRLILSTKHRTPRQIVLIFLFFGVERRLLLLLSMYEGEFGSTTVKCAMTSTSNYQWSLSYN